MAYDPYRYHPQWETYDREGSAVSAWSLGVFVLIVFGLLFYAASNSNSNLSLEKMSAAQAETTGGPALPLRPQWPAPPAQFE